jgi:hypothetical protein
MQTEFYSQYLDNSLLSEVMRVSSLVCQWHPTSNEDGYIALSANSAEVIARRTQTEIDSETKQHR